MKRKISGKYNHNGWKRTISAALTAVMLLSSVPVNAPASVFADGTYEENIYVSKEKQAEVFTDRLQPEPLAETPVSEVPAAESLAEEPVPEAPAVESLAEEPVLEVPAAESLAEEPVPEAPAVESLAEELVPEEPTPEGFTSEELSPEEPFMEESSPEDLFTEEAPPEEPSPEEIFTDRAEAPGQDFGSGQEDAPSESLQPQTLTYEDAAVRVSVTETEPGVLPQGVSLQVQPILQTDPQYEEVEAKLTEKAEQESYEIAGFLAYDITLADEAGNSIEPAGLVHVNIQYLNPTKPEIQANAETFDVRLMHLEENEEGTVEQVADVTPETVELSPGSETAVESLAFTADSFSVYTITWTYENTEFQDIRVNLNASFGYLDGETFVPFTKDVVEEFHAENKGQQISLRNYDKEEAIRAAGFSYCKTMVSASGLEQAVETDTLQMAPGALQYAAKETGKWTSLISTTGRSETDLQVYYIYEDKNAEGSLQQKINAAKPGDTITLDREYTENLVILDGQEVVIDLNGHKIHGADHDDAMPGGDVQCITVYGTLSIQDSVGGGEICGDGHPSMQGVLVESGGHFTLNGGSIAGFFSQSNGGGIQMYNGGHVTINGGSIKNNGTAGYGGGIFVYDSDDLELNGGEISGNQAENGGAVAVYSAGSGKINLKTAARFAGNHANTRGGGLYVSCSLEELRLEGGMLIEGNTAGENGGGLFLQEKTKCVMNGITLSGNQGYNGGGFYLSGGSCLEMDQCIIKGNTVSKDGGGFYLYSNSGTSKSTFTVNGCEISENRIVTADISKDTNGAGAFLGAYAEGVINNTQVIRNEGAIYGGGLCLEREAVSEIDGCTFAENKVETEKRNGSGGAISSQGDTIVRNTVVCSNTAYNGGGIQVPNATLFLQEGCVIEKNEGTGSGGGVYVMDVEVSQDTKILRNKAKVHGGGIHSSNIVWLQDDVLIKGNEAGDYGGGIAVACDLYISGNVRIENNTAMRHSGGAHVGRTLMMDGGCVTGNTAASGGGFYLTTTDKSVISGGEICRNYAKEKGGGICKYSTSELKITGSARIYENEAPYGGGIEVSNGTVQMSGGIVTDNQADCGGGVSVQSIGVNSGARFELLGGAVYGNNARLSRKGHDISVRRKNPYTNEAIQDSSMFLTKANSIALEDGRKGLFWYAEQTNEIQQEAVKFTYGPEFYNTGAAYGYTFVFSRSGEEVAQVGEKKFSYVTQAVNAIANQETSENTIVLLKDCKEDVAIPKDVKLTLDLNGKTMWGRYSSVLHVQKGAELTIRDSSEEKSGKITGGVGYLKENDAYRYGGGLYVEGRVILEEGSVEENHAFQGGGIYVDGGFLQVGTKEGTAPCIKSNTTDESAGGIFVQNGGQLILESGEITGNKGLYAGGVRLQQKSHFTMNGGCICRNTGIAIAGGVMVESVSVFIMNDGTIKENEVGSGGSIQNRRGGGIDSVGGIVSVTGGRIEGNRASYGGGISCYGGNQKFSITGGVITGNISTEEGGGIFSKDGRGEISLTGGEIYGNVDASSGHSDIILYAGAKLTMKNVNKNTEYVYWHDLQSGAFLSAAEFEIMEDKTSGKYALAADKDMSEETEKPAARIGKTTYPTVQSAILAAIENQEEAPVIYLLRDVSEQVVVSGDKEKELTIDFNGYTWIVEKSNGILVRSGNLKIQDISQEKDRKKEGVGTLTMAEGSEAARGVYVEEEAFFTLGANEADTIQLTGFSGMAAGGAVYLSCGSSMVMKGGAVTYNQAEYGGGIGNVNSGINQDTTLQIQGGRIAHNRAVWHGGGICLKTNALNDRFSSLEITGGTIEENRAQEGGGVYYYNQISAVTNQSSFTFTGGVIQKNQASEGHGGGVFLKLTKKVEVGGSAALLENRAGQAGGGLANLSAGAIQGEFLLSGGRIEGNEAGTSGGGIYSDSDNTVNGGIIKGNRASVKSGYGGGMQIGPVTTLLAGEISDNESFSGGGIAFWGTGVIPENSISHIFENKASYCGGGIYISSGVDLNCYGGEVRNNISAHYGGGIGAVGSTVHFHLKGIQITGNEALTGGGVYKNDGSVTIEEGTLITENRAQSGGGLLGNISNITITGGRIEDNHAETNGGGIHITSNTYLNKRETVITGGVITGNSADSGGGIYNNQLMSLKVRGGEITGNQARIRGGGIYSGANETETEVTLADGTLDQDQENPEYQKGGQVYGNLAGLGQDIFVAYHANIKTSSLRLRDARGMFETSDEREGLGWHDEKRDMLIKESIAYQPALQDYPLTLEYTKNKTIAVINGGSYDSVQAAVDAVAEKTYPNANETEIPIIHMVADNRENVTVPGDTEMMLNLNGYILNGVTTAITCYGNLEIIDRHENITVMDEGQRTSYSHGTMGQLMGKAAGSGGGIRVCSGGYVKLSSGRIANSSANGLYGGNTYGGGGVCVDYGTFELTGDGEIIGNNANYGSAVYVGSGSSTFLMTGGSIENNRSPYDGTVYVKGGTFRMTGGRISNNQAAGCGGGVNVPAGNMVADGSQNSSGDGVFIENNTAHYGGGIYQTGGTVSLKKIRISGNKAYHFSDKGYQGGGIYQQNGTLNLYEDCFLTGNTAREGGGIYQNWGSIYMIGGAITGNTAETGGGLMQFPSRSALFEMNGGQIYGNISRLSGAGNDIYSWLEENPDKTNSRATLIKAVDMGNPNYNVWRDDTYLGPDRESEFIGKGQHITGVIDKSRNLQLTAVRYGDTAAQEKECDLYIKSLIIGDGGDEEQLQGEPSRKGIVDGTAAFDDGKQELPDVGQKEKTAYDLLKDGLAKESSETYTYNGKEYEKIEYEGKLYERDEAVLWSPGDDSGSSNGIIRTNDQVTYTLYAGFGLADPNTVKPEESEKKNYRMWIEVTIPNSSQEAAFRRSLDMQTLQSYYVMEEDGKQIMRGYWDIQQLDGGLEAKNIVISVKNMKNGEKLKPAFKLWLEGNEENTFMTQDGTEHKKDALCQAKNLTVSAAPRYNVVLQQNKELAYTGYFNLETGEEASKEEMELHPDQVIYGTMLGYGLTLEMANKYSRKGIKGLEAPKGGITFTVNMEGSLYMNGSPILDKNGNPITNKPILWAYKANEVSSYGINGKNYGFQMDWNDEDDVTRTTSYGWNAAPFNAGSDKSYSCYSGGVWKIQDNKNGVFECSVSGYSIDSEYKPIRSSDNKGNAVFNKEQVLPFSAGYVQVIYPIDVSEVKDSGYVSIMMDSAAADFEACSASGLPLESTDEIPEELKVFFGDDYVDGNGEHLGEYHDRVKNEMDYKDNFLRAANGLYIFKGEGNWDWIIKDNYFLNVVKPEQDDGNDDNDQTTTELSEDRGTSSVAIGSQVYVSGDLHYGSMQFNTTDEKDPRYNPDFNIQVDNMIEYNYMTAVDFLQKIDADVYTPMGSEAIVNETITLKDGAASIGGTYGNAFRISSTETETTWSKDKTRKLNLTVLYAAKPDGKNWTKNPLPEDGNLVVSPDSSYGGERDMDNHEFEDLLYFKTLEDLYAYFGGMDEKGQPKGKCVGILYQVRDCCVRTGRSMTFNSRMRISSEFKNTGRTFAVTNDARIFTTYRPDYKKFYNENRLNDIIYLDTALNHEAKVLNGVSAYRPEEVKQLTVEDIRNNATGDIKNKYSTARFDPNYIKTEYGKDGFQVKGTHTGWYSGNTLLLHTLQSAIEIEVRDRISIHSNSPKTTYVVNKGERTANYIVKPRLAVDKRNSSNEIVASGAVAADVVITLELPEHLTYNKGSVWFDYTNENCSYKDGELSWDIHIEEDPNGISRVILKTSVREIGKGLPDICYSCTVGIPGANETADVPNGSGLTTYASIHTIYQEEGNITSASQMDSVRIIAMRESEDTITKDTPKHLMEIGEDFSYSLWVDTGKDSDAGESADLELCDILPYNGDGRETKFTGGYRLKTVEVIFPGDGELTEHQKSSVVKLAKDESLKVPGTNGALPESQVIQKVKELGKAQASVANERTLLYSFDENPQAVMKASDKAPVALYVNAKGVSSGKLEVRITLTPEEQTREKSGTRKLIADSGKLQQGGNIYWNNFIYVISGGTVTSAKSYVRTVQRTIRGIVFMDQDQDGVYIPGTAAFRGTDKGLKHMDVYLCAKKPKEGEPNVLVQDADGNHIETAKIGTESYYQVKDVLGNPVKPYETGAEGTYFFTNLAQGNYAVIIKDAGNTYQVADTKAQPLGFEALSVTPKREDAQKTEQLPKDATNKALPQYQTEDTDKAPGELGQANITNGGAGISLPAKETMYMGEYVTANWNAGFYYIDQNIIKEWGNVYEIPPIDTKVEFTFAGTAQSAEGKDPVTYQQVVYTLKQQGPEAEQVVIEAYPSDSEIPLPKVLVENKTGDKNTMTLRWKAMHQALQAEDASGRVIQYTVEENGAYGPDGEALHDFIVSSDQQLTDKGSQSTFTAYNVQLLYHLAIIKRSASEPAEGEEKQRLKGAEFTLYADKGCTNKIKLPYNGANGAVTSAEEEALGQASFENLKEGTYYLKETKAPVGYGLNDSVFEIKIAYKPQEPALPEVQITEFKSDGQEVKVNALVTPELPQEGAGPGITAVRYTISFDVEDECIYELPKTGGPGIFWNLALGMVILLTAFWLLEQKYKNTYK